jgi:hypothetical protein
MNLSKRDVKLLLILLGILLFIAVYVFVYLRVNDKTGAMEAETAALQPRLTELRGYFDSLSVYEAGIGEGKTLLGEKLKGYPNDVRAEDGVMYAVELENNAGLDITNAAFGEPNLVMELRGILDDGHGGYTPAPFSAYRRTFAYSCELSYRELKEAVAHIRDTAMCTRLNNVSVSYNSETGELIGSIAVDKYFITGADGDYHETVVPDMPLGTDDIFGTVSGGAEEALEAAPPETEE